jgi:hypothetical protein
MGALTNLTSVAIGGNAFTGKLPTMLGLLIQLTHLSISGSVSKELGQLTMLWNLWLIGNDLKGTFPLELCYLSSLSGKYIDCDKVDCPVSCYCDCM